MDSTAARPRIVIVGGGFGGLAAIRGLKAVDVDHPHRPAQPPPVPAAALPGRHRALAPRRSPRRSACSPRAASHHRARHRHERRRGRDTAQLETARRLPYDLLLLATGARHAYFGHDDWEQHAPGLKTLEDATAIRRRCSSPSSRPRWRPTPPAQGAAHLRGGRRGPTGVELAGAIGEMAGSPWRATSATSIREAARVVLIEAGPRVLPTSAGAVAPTRARDWRRSASRSRSASPSRDRCHAASTSGHERIEAATVMWAAGVQASPAAKWLGAADRPGRVMVEPDLSVPGHPDIFAIGDMRRGRPTTAGPLPGLGAAAKQDRATSRRTIMARLAGHRRACPSAIATRPHRHHRPQPRAATSAGFGLPAGSAGASLAHIYFLVGFKNRLFIALNWLSISITGYRSARLITQDMPGSASQPGDATPADAGGPQSEPASASLRA